MNALNLKTADGYPQFDVYEQLTEHFNLSEMLYSRTCDEHGIINRVSDYDTIIPRLRTLCQRVLEPMREHFGPICINSGYRSECLNAVVKGVKNSQHCQGEAADLRTPTIETALRYMEFVEKNLDFDQLILEHIKGTGHFWVHVSYTERYKNRKESFKMM